MDQPQFAPPPNDAVDPLAVASVCLAVAGIIAFCGGYFCCMWWIGPILWLLGAALGGVAISKNEGSNRTIGIVGVAANVVLGVGMSLLMLLGIGAAVLGNLANY